MRKKFEGLKSTSKFFVLLFLLLSLVLGFGFSTYKVVNEISLGAKFVGGYQALVGVYNKSQSTNDNDGLPNGDASKGAAALEKKLSPFSNNTIEIQKAGKSRILVNAPRNEYHNSQEVFKNTIERTGGLFILDNDYKDIFFNQPMMTEAGVGNIYNTDSSTTANKRLENKLSLEDFLGESATESLQPTDATTKNAPYVTFKLTKDYLTQLIANKSKKANTNFTMLTSVGDILTTLRSYYSYSDSISQQNRYEFLETYFNNIVKPIQDWINANKTKVTEVNALKDLFAIQYSVKDNSGNWVTGKLASLVGDDILKWWDSNKNGTINSVRDLSFVLFGGYSDNSNKVLDPVNGYRFKFINSVNKYLYDPNSTAKDFNANGIYSKKIQATPGIESMGGASELDFYDKTANTIVSVMMKEILFKDSTIDANNIVNRNLRQSLFVINEVLLRNSTILNQNSILSKQPTVVENKKAGTKKLYIPTRNYTMSKEIEADILQTTLGYTFKVLSIEPFDATVTMAMLISTLICLLILIISLMVFLVFVYRLLGIFTIILAAIVASLTLLLPIIFSIAVGPEIFTVLFVSVGLVLDTCIIYFETFKKNIYIEKRSPESSFKISNKDTLSILLDASFIIWVPNIILFIFGSGALKNMATIGVISILFVMLFAIIGLRLLIWLVVKNRLFIKYPWLLPLNTKWDSKSSIYNDLMLSYYNSKAQTLNAKTKLTGIDLAKLKRVEDKLKYYQKRQQEIINLKEKKLAEKNQRKVKTYDKKITKLKKYNRLNKLNQKHSILLKKQEKIINYLSGQIKETKRNKLEKSLNKIKKLIDRVSLKIRNIELNPQKADSLFFGWFKRSIIKDWTILKNYSLAQLDSSTDQQTLNNLRNKKNQRKIFNINKAFALFFVFCISLGAGLGLTIGPNYSSSFGKNISVTLYGQRINDIYNNLGSTIISYNESNNPKIREMGRFLDHEKRIDDQEMESRFKNKYDNVDQKDKNYWAAFVVAGAFKTIVNKNYVRLWNKDIDNYRFIEVDVEYNSNYIDVSSPTNTEYPWISFVIRNARNDNIINIFESLFVSFIRVQGNPEKNPGKWNHKDNNSSLGIINLINTPYTAFGEILKMAIVLGLSLIALSVYMLIRFKWTYFVALALSVIITIILVTSLVMILRIPVGIEILGAILAILSFAIITSVLTLGKGKSLMKSKDFKTFSKMFESEIKVISEMRKYKHQIKDEIKLTKKEFISIQKENAPIKKSDKKSKFANWLFDLIFKFKLRYSKKHNSLYQQFKLNKKELQDKIKANSKKSHEQLSTLVEQNNFLKEVFVDVFKFGINRTLLVTSIYIIYALIIALCMPSILSMGITIIIGIVVSTLVSLVIALPIWIKLERKRIIYILGYKYFVQNLEVSQEEQVVVGIND